MSEKKHLSALGLWEDDKNDFEKIKKAFTKKIRTPFIYRADRIKYNVAFEYLCNWIYKVEEPADQKSIIDAIYKGDINSLRKKLKNNPKLVNFRKKGTNYPLLYLATRSGHYDVVELILESGCNLDFSKDRSTPMHCAAFYGYDYLIPLLFKYGIPTNIKNFSQNIPEQEASKESIKTLLKSYQQDVLMGHKLAIGTLNLCLEEQKSENPKYDVRKIILKGYFDDHSNYADAFHGTNFQALDSIAQHGLRAPGQKIGDKKLEIVDGHIPLGTKVKGFEDWAKAVFVSPSIYYAGDPCYAKPIIIDGANYCPLVQVKVKQGTFSSHNHTFVTYNIKNNEPNYLEFRVQCDINKDNQHIYRSPDHKNVKVVAILLVRIGLLADYDNYQQVTDFILNSEDEKIYRIKGQMQNLNI